MPLHIRPYQPSDEAPLRARFAGDTKPPWMRLPHPYTLEHLLAPMATLAVFVAEMGPGRVAGLVAVDESEQRPFVIGPLVADDQLADLTGRALLDYALGWAYHNGIVHVRVKVDIGEERALGFFINQGFVALEVREHVLEARPARHEPTAAPEGFSFGPCPEMLSSDYLKLYQALGGPLGWPDRGQWSRPQIFEHLQRPGAHLLAAREGDAFIGFAELEERQPGEAELVHFGLLEPWRGRGLGGAFLEHVLAYAWENLRLQRIQVTAHSTDTPQALPNFLKRGFTKERAMVFLERDLDAAFPPDRLKTV